MKVIDPATGDTLREVSAHTQPEIDARITRAYEAFTKWRAVELATRAKHMRGAAALLRARHREWADLMASEMGKPIKDGRSEAEKCASACDFYAENAARFLASEEIKSDARRSVVAFRPLGVVLAVMPWNFPFWQVLRFAAPALMAGNAGVLKHASNVPGCALAIETIFREAGFPAGLFSTVLAESSQVDAMIAHPNVAAVTLTGSTGAGRAVARKAGEMLKKTVLELGGSDPYIVLADADVEHAADICVKSRLINAGQSCIAAKRFIVVPEVAAQFEALFVERMKRIKVGDPRDETTDIGPLAKVELRNELHQQVQESIRKGARLLLGGEVPARPGAWYPPTVLTDVKPGMPAYDDELFGPVAAIIRARDEDDAIRIANDSAYGLGAAVFTRDLARGEHRATIDVEAGNCFVNTFVRSDPRLPFGGIKESGYGRELSSFGIREFVNLKTVYVA